MISPAEIAVRIPRLKCARFLYGLLFASLIANAAEMTAPNQAMSGDAVTTRHQHDVSLPATSSDTPLTMQDAIRLALTDQPMLAARQASIDAAEQQAISASQLPDPKLTAGVKDLPVDTSSAYSVRDDNFTMFTVGLIQDFPRGDKLRLKGLRKHLEADMDRFGMDNDKRAITRETALAWLDVSEAEQALALTRKMGAESGLQIKSLESAYQNGRASQADWLAAKVEAGLVNDKVADWQHRGERMRAGLSRWIGDEAQRPLVEDLSTLSPMPTLPALIAAVDQHPSVSSLKKQIEVSDADIGLAKQAYKSDFSVEGYFGYRPAYADFAGVQVTMDLPFFGANRQDRELSAALRLSDAAQDHKADLLRDLHSQVTQNYIDWHHARERAETFDSEIIPDAQRRVDAARSAYASGRGSFDAVISARRGLLDTELQRLALVVESARAQVRVQYFSAQGAIQ
jgi:cobalt-zinc-cadmium efflux system outer membrane protein